MNATRLCAPVSACLLLGLAGAARADALDEVRQRGVLRWGGDQEGGGPYIYPAPDDPRRLTGFEVDLLALVAEHLGVRQEFQQCEWRNLPDLLRRGGIDVIANGYELSRARASDLPATVPYYVYELALYGRRDDPSLASWEDLAAPGGKRRRVGVLTGSAAEVYLQGRFGAAIDLVPYDSTTLAFDNVQDERLDATVQDVPAAVFYGGRYPKLHAVGGPTGRGYYVMALRPGDERLRDAIDAAVLDLVRSGRLRQLYERYGIWNSAQEVLGTPDLGAEETQASTQVSGWDAVRRNLPLLLQAAGMTVVLTCLSMPLAVTAGLLIALGRLYGPWPLRGVLAAYVEGLRGTPVMLQLYAIFYVLPAVGLRLHPLTAAVLGLAINYSAYEAEIYRAGLLAIPAGQMEAALCLGMSRATALRRVVVPQAVRLVVPPVTNDFIALFKDTSICSVVTVVELTKQYSILASSTGASLELAAVTALLYLLMSYPLSLLARRLEKRVPRVVA